VLQTILRSVISLANLFALLALLIFISALLGMQLVGGRFTPEQGFEEVRQRESNRRACISWSRTGGPASAGVEPEALHQLGCNRRACISWSRTGGPASAGVEPEALRQLESNRRPCVSWSRTGGPASAGM
jgi:hypothetical protein